MIRTSLVTLAAAAVALSAFAVSSADARTYKRERQYYYDYGQQNYFAQPSSSPSLDGRVTGRARTCGSSTFVYDNRGVPTGPYCH
jgi:hypothetical protein